MSGFDFDALRDPEAPIPGGRERDGVTERARHIRARQLRTRATIGTTALVVVVGAVLGIVAAQRQRGPEIAVPGVSTSLPTTPATAGPSIDNRFIPPTTTENGKVVLPVTQPDGSTFTIRYPPNLRIAQLGFSGLINVEWPGTGRCCGASPQFSYTTIEKVYGKAKPIAVYPGAEGEKVGLYDIPFEGGIPAGPTATRELAFQFGPWLVRVDASEPDPKNFWPVPMSEQHLAIWARSLSGTVDSSGYLLLHARAPLSVGNRFSGGFGPDTSQPNYSASNNLSFDSHLVCGHAPSAVSMDPLPTPFLTGTLGNGNVQWCADKLLHVHATGSAKFLTAALHDLEVSTFRAAATGPSTTTTTTTTQPRVVSNDSAESSSWVSAQQGWALEKNGRIAESADGGASWHPVGEIGVHGLGWKIRFIGGADGFAFEPNAGSPALMITHDAGHTWTKLDTRFGQVLDLAIARGMVYAVAFSPNSPVAGAIWSTPVEHLVWKRDPLAITTGAGPVAQAQLVLIGGKGWLLQVNRTVIGGAELAASNHWIKWSAVCDRAGGPAYLSASTDHDLAASCNEGVWTGPRITNGVYFSHDGGATFDRHTAPQFGPIASPQPDIAVIAGAAGIDRTTDGGKTWQKVYAARPNSRAVDLGFTTPTQGFVISASGLMLMTHDAGATWTRVSLP